MHLVLTGATGLVGSAVLHQMLIAPSVTKLTILSRRPVAQADGHTKANVVIQKDFANYDSEVMDGLKDVKGVVWAQGISVNSVDKEYVPLPSGFLNLVREGLQKIFGLFLVLEICSHWTIVNTKG
jgi:uncharacterized protein YbjT (DUF2867 family)